MRLKPKLILTNLSLALMLVISPIAQSKLLSQPATNASQLAANRYDSSNDIFHPIYGKNGMVAVSSVNIHSISMFLFVITCWNVLSIETFSLICSC